MLHYSKVIQGIANYIDAEIVSKLSGSLKGWFVGALAGVAVARAELVYKNLKNSPIAAVFGLVEGENVDVDIFINELRKQAQKGTATATIPMIGPITFTSADVDALYRYIKA